MGQRDHMAQKIFFLHIPKTGGQTVATRLATAYPTSKADILGEDFNYPNGSNQLRAKFESCDFVERHISGPILENLDDIEVLTFIRDPVSQIVSSFLHIKREPRNPLSRAANKLSPQDFFERFGDFFYNRQASYLVGAYFASNDSIDRPSFLMNRLHAAAEKTRWLVPTEYINDFIPLWCAENEKHISCENINVNVASRTGQRDSISEIVRGMPDLYAIDLVLWRIAHQRYAQYKDAISRKLYVFNYPDNAYRAFFKDQAGIWLRTGWYPPEISTDGNPVWWSGPKARSEVSYKRKLNQNQLRFTLEVVCGITPSQIAIYSENMEREIPTTIEVLGNSKIRLAADIKDLPLQSSIFISVPEVWAPIMVTEDDDNIDRKSFAASDWEIAY
jgi:hypothetical protein